MNADPSNSVPHRSFSEIKRQIREQKGLKSEGGLNEPLSYDEFMQYLKDAEIEEGKAKDMIVPRVMPRLYLAMKEKEAEMRVMPPWYLAMKKKEAEIEDDKDKDMTLPFQLETETEIERAERVARIKENRKAEAKALAASPEVWSKYRKQMEESEGFDITDFPGTCLAAKIIPIELDIYPISKSNATKHAKFVIKEHNKSIKELGEEKEYVFKELLSANTEMVCGIRYYLTFEANEVRLGNESAPTVRTFQARVLLEPGPSYSPIIELFRPKQKEVATKNEVTGILE